MFGIFDKKETRQEVSAVPQSAHDFLQRMGISNLVTSAPGVNVSTDAALGVPAVWAAVNFLSGTLAGLPLKVYRKGRKGRSEVKTGVAPILHEAVNDGMSSFEWRKGFFDATFTTGRGLSYIERNNAGRVVNIWPFDPSKISVKLVDGRKVYIETSGSRKKEYQASEVIDVPFMLKPDMVSHRAPIATCRDAIGMAIAATNFGSKMFQKGGLPPTFVQGPFQSAEAARRASDDLSKVMSALAEDSKSVMALPMNHEIKSLGFKPDEMQLLELQRFLVEQIARIYNLPPVFLQDLTHGTFSNTEQQDLHFVKHTVKRWVEQTEQELNLKLFGRGSNLFVEFNVDGLLRGDIKTRMEAHSTAIQNGIYTPSHASAIENYPHNEAGDQLFMQGGTMPIEQVKGSNNDSED